MANLFNNMPGSSADVKGKGKEIIREEEQDLHEFKNLFNLEKRISKLEALFHYLKTKKETNNDDVKSAADSSEWPQPAPKKEE